MSLVYFKPSWKFFLIFINIVKSFKSMVFVEVDFTMAMENLDAMLANAKHS